MAKFLIVDDHPMFREALQSAIQLAYPDGETVEATSIADAITVLEDQAGSFDIALLDLSMPGTTGFEGLLEIRTRFPKLPVVIVSGLEGQRVIQHALSCGVAGFIPKSSKKAELADALTAVMTGAVYVPEGYSEESEDTEAQDAEAISKRLSSLTQQQMRVLLLIRQGLLNKQIAFELNVGETTVKAHVSEILRKLHAYSRTQAVIMVSKIDFDSIMESRQPGE